MQPSVDCCMKSVTSETTNGPVETVAAQATTFTGCGLQDSLTITLSLVETGSECQSHCSDVPPVERDDGQVINRSLIILQATMHVRGMRSHTLVCKRGKGAGNLHCCHYAVRLHNYLQKLTKQPQTLKLPTEVVISAQDRILRCDWSCTVQCSTTNCCKGSYQPPSSSCGTGWGYVRLGWRVGLPPMSHRDLVLAGHEQYTPAELVKYY